MKLCLVLLTVTVLAATGFPAGADQHWPLPRSGTAGERSGVMCPPFDSVWLDSILDTAMTIIPLPGMATVIVKDGEVIWDSCYGYAILEENIPVTDTTVFTLASISKTATGMALMQLWEDGYFDLDGDVSESLPFTVRHSRFPDTTITYRMLLTHTSNIKDNWAVMDRYWGQGDPDSSLATFVHNYFVPGASGYDSARNFWQYNAPGQSFLYCNAAYALLGYAAECMADSFQVYTREHIFEPLGMDRTCWLFGDLDTMTCACQYSWDTSRWNRLGYQNGSFFPPTFLKSCTRDLAEYLKMWLAWGRYDTLQLLDSATVAMMQTPYVYGPSFLADFGFSWYTHVLNGDTVWCHGGGWHGVSTFLAISRQKNCGLAVLTNADMNAYNRLVEIVPPALYGFVPPGVAESPGPNVEWLPSGTFVRGVLELRGPSNAVLLDITGRKVANLVPGPNDVRHLSPGVYSLRQEGSAATIRKVIMTQ